ncbi:MAG TPA: ATP-binding protein [Myxococcaceae bacterium]|nr:ATP-binding protein [Myxococcaceae bacterium]
MLDTAVRRPTVWIVDDSPVDRSWAQRALVQSYDVELFTDGSAALEALGHRQPPTVLVLDWVMPGITGIEVVEFLRSSTGQLPQVPVLLLTAQNEPAQIVQGLTAGANDYLSKPYRPEELQARVAALVRSAELLERATRAEQSVRVMLANAPDAFVAVDAQGRLTFANEEAGRVFGVPAEKLVGRRLTELVPDFPARNITVGPGEPLLPLSDVRIGERVFSPSVRVLPTDTAANTTISFRDVTLRRQAEARRLDFYSIIAHDLRSPLSAMMIRTETIIRGRRGSLSAELLSELMRFQGSMRAMVAMINDFLDLARLEGAGQKITQEEVDLGALAQHTMDELRPLAEAKQLTLRWVPSPRPLSVLGDGKRLAQVVSNLIGNAVKFTPPDGTVVVGVTEAGSMVETFVTDSGPGIPQQEVATLFDRFTRASSSSGVQGTGLGLMIVREIVEAHGGRVGVNTEQGKGSTFWFRVPGRG